MPFKKASYLILVISTLSLFVQIVPPAAQANTPKAPVSAPQAPALTWTFQGRVFSGEVGDETQPIPGVTVAVYGANDVYPIPGTFVRSTTTDGQGWYNLNVYDDDGAYDYYYLLETDPPGYFSVGATSVDGEVKSDDWIQYAMPLDGKTLSGNKFWDQLPTISGRVYEGDVGNESEPLSGVTVGLYGANNPYPDPGTLIASTTTDTSGWYGLEASGSYEFYLVRETDPEGYVSTGATSVSGTVHISNCIEYAMPLDNQTLTGNKFWDHTATVTHTLEGRVYEGDVGNETAPLENVVVAVYGAHTPHPDAGELLATTTTDPAGWYGLDVPEGYAFYHLRETDPASYASVGATTVSGTVQSGNWIEYAGPLDGKTLTGNKFWDTITVTTHLLEGYVFEGSVGIETQPLEGITVAAYGANNPYPDSGEFIISATTTITGWYGLEVPAWFEFYQVREMDPEGYVSDGATTISGTVRTNNWIEYAIPLEGQVLVDNKFWDQTAAVTHTLEGQVYQGEVGDESSPLEGVAISAYGAVAPYPEPGELITTAATGPAGGYRLVIPEGYAYYYVRETDLEGYASAGATTISGTVQTANWIEYAAPLVGSAITGDKFWDHTDVALPDLVVTDVWQEGNAICYQVMNVGIASAPAGHSTALFVDSAKVASEQIETPLAMDQRHEGCFDYDWTCTPIEDVVLVRADAADDIAEVEEDNNDSVKVWACDPVPPEIVWGPEVISTTTHSAIIAWQTDEETSGFVRYGATAGVYDVDEPSPITSTTAHTVTLVGLGSATTYHFYVETADASGNSAESADMTFETLPPSDDQDPTVQLVDVPSVLSGTVTIAAQGTDNVGMEQVAFYLDGQLIFIDYSPPYEFEWDTTPYEDGQHTLRIAGYDLVGRWSDDEITVDLKNLRDTTVPVVVITAPSDGTSVSGKVNVTAELADDTGLTFVFFRVDGNSTGFQGLPTKPTSTTVSFEWDTTLETSGAHQITVEAYDKDGKIGSDTHGVTVGQVTPPSPAQLKIVQHQAARIGHGFVITLAVKNVGQETASDIEIEDYMKGFQPISRTSTIPTSADYAVDYDPYKKESQCKIDGHADLAPGETLTFVYHAAPVLHDASAPTPAIGYQTYLHYDRPNGTRVHDGVAIPVAKTIGGYAIWVAHAKAVRQADYLIVTNPTRLFAFSYPNTNGVYPILSEMAQLAVYKQGALGYLSNPSGSVFDKLISPSGTWAKALHANFSVAGKGYLLIVGENEIIPGWWYSGWNIKWKGGKTTNVVNFSDHGYADTSGDGAPDLVLGRIIGDTPGLIVKALRASNRSFAGWTGYGFDRSHALLVSGTDPYQGAFINDVNTLATSLTKDGFTVDKLHWSGVQAGYTQTQEFLNRTPNNDVIVFRGHGTSWEWQPGFLTGNTTQLDLGNVNPFVLAFSCSTGNYDGITGMDDFSIGEAFFWAGGAAYIGSTEVSANSTNSVASQKFFSFWDPYEYAGQALNQLERDRWGHSKLWNFWVTEYNYYGDPKYGAAPPSSQLALAPQETLASPVSSLNVVVPDYVVTTTEGFDYVTIPDGDLILEKDQPQIPYYAVTLTYSQSFKIQGVVLTSTSGLSTTSGLNLPITPMAQDGVQALRPSATVTETEWLPEKEYEWQLLENPEGTTTLIILIYPFRYNPATTDIEFYKNFDFEILYTVSPVSITGLSTDRSAYPQGDPVTVEIALGSNGTMQDGVVNASVRRFGSDELVDGLLLRTLKGITGTASFATEWDSTGTEPGLYYVDVTLQTPGGEVLDRQAETFRVGVPGGAIVDLAAAPEQFEIGDAVGITMTFENTGTVPISGTMVVQVRDADGTALQTFREDTPEMTPGETYTFSDAWDTSGVARGTYIVMGYVLYDAEATAPVTVEIRSPEKIYLPLIIKNSGG